MDERRQNQGSGRTATDTPFADEVRHPEHAGRNPTTPDDHGDPKRQAEAPKTTQRQE